jgi:hypothetical protein
MIGGFHVAALVRHGWQREAERLLADAGRSQPPGHRTRSGSSTSGCTANSGHPMGFAQQAWSAAMFLYAEHAVRTGSCLLFDDLLAAKPAAAVASEDNEFHMAGGGGPA